jgi:hypothetical protein
MPWVKKILNAQISSQALISVEVLLTRTYTNLYLLVYTYIHTYIHTYIRLENFNSE